MYWPWSKEAGEALKSSREAARLTQEELAHQSDLSCSCVARLEQGIGHPSKRTRRALLSVLPGVAELGGT